MIPKKAKEFVNPAAEKLELDPQFVRDLVDFYWKEVRKNLSDLKAPRVNVSNFGYFQLKFWNLPKVRENYQKHLDSLNPEKMTFMKHKIREDVLQRIEAIDKVTAIVEEDLLRKTQLKEKRNAQKTTSNLEESEGDLSGNKE